MATATGFAVLPSRAMARGEWPLVSILRKRRVKDMPSFSKASLDNSPERFSIMRKSAPAKKALSRPEVQTRPFIASLEIKSSIKAVHSFMKSSVQTFIDWSGTLILARTMPALSMSTVKFLYVIICIRFFKS